jgi:serine/threonine protein phosphatase 1
MSGFHLELSRPGRLYVIGDIHGRADLLDLITEEIRGDLTARPVDVATTVTLGDYVDRGPDSKGVIDRLARNPFPTPYLALKGNHEEIFQAFPDEPWRGPDWRYLGGLETLHSYGIAVARLMRDKGYEEASEALRARLPPEHAAFLSSLKISISTDDYFLCHAGVRPGIPLDRQSADDLLWIRDEFLDSRADFGKIVVHGHTPAEQPEVCANRINIDTGAFATGRLTCVVLGDGPPRFLST